MMKILFKSSKQGIEKILGSLRNPFLKLSGKEMELAGGKSIRRYQKTKRLLTQQY